MGEEAVSCIESLRLATLAKTGGARVIAGGCFFGHVAREALKTGLIDAVVHGEGEQTLVELVQALRGGTSDALSQIAGISFRCEDEIVTTSPRPLLNDLDALPMPAYDLLPVHRYGARSRNHPHLAAIELGRGCAGTCDFCVLWRQMGRFVGGRVVPHLRVKSAERLLEEIRLLVHRYDRRYLGWVDPCFNAHPEVPGQLAERLLREGLCVGQSAWVRTDALIRDTNSGALEHCVRAGLNEVYLGIERPDAAGLAALHKSSNGDHAREAMRILQKRFPEVLAVGSFIYGLPGDTPASIRAIHRQAVELQLDQFFFIPLTPLPGTSGWDPDSWDPTGQFFRRLDFLPGSKLHATHPSLERAMVRSLLFHWSPQRLAGYWRRLFRGDARKRRVGWRLIMRGAVFQLRWLMSRRRGKAAAGGLVIPDWYES
jgi:anaerobic magnesium-protoporphyrin IX monomethyl ester cyclase